MSNLFAPFGFADSHRLGAAVNYQSSRRWILPSNPTSIYQGDPIIQLSSGYIAQAPSAGPFVGSISTNQLTVTTPPTTALAVGTIISGPGVTPGTVIVSGSSSPYTLNQNSTVGSGTTMQATPAGQIAGIFNGCEYMSISRKTLITSNWWPATADVVLSGTGFDVKANVIDDPLTVFRVQTNSTGTLAPVGLAGMGANIQFNIGTGNGITGKSGAWVDAATLAVGANSGGLAFRVIDIVRDPPGSNGADPTTPYNWIYVGFNNQDYRTLTAA